MGDVSAEWQSLATPDQGGILNSDIWKHSRIDGKGNL